MGNYPATDIPNVGDFINNPSRIERVLRKKIEGKSIADYAFVPGDAKGGAVVYSELTEEPGKGARDVEIIAPGANFPGVDLPEEEEKAAKVAKYGGDTWMTYESRDRNDSDVLKKRLEFLSNLVIAKTDKAAVAAIASNTNINKVTASGIWGTAGIDQLADIFLGKASIDDLDLGYESNLLLIHPADAQKYLLGDKSVREQLPKETAALNPVLSGDLGKLCGVEWIKTKNVARGKLYILDRGQAGSVRDEHGGVKTNTYDKDENQRVYMQAWRSMVAVVTDPLAITEVSGFAA